MSSAPDSLPIDLIQIRDWLLEEFDRPGGIKPSLLSILVGISGDNGAYFINPKAVMAFRKEHSQATTLPSSAQISHINRLLLAPACYLRGEELWRWFIPLKLNRDLTPSAIEVRHHRKSWRTQFAKLKGKEPIAFLQAWHEQKDSERKLGSSPSKSKATQQQSRQNAQALNTACTRLLGDIASRVSDQTPVLLVAYGGPMCEALESAAHAWRGRALPRSRNTHAFWFEHDDRLAIPATRAMQTAYQFLSDSLRDKSIPRRSGSRWRMLILRAPAQQMQTEELAAAVGRRLRHDTLGDPSGEVYLDAYLWATLGNWANADRRPPARIPGLSKLGKQWARLDGFGTLGEAFTESMVKRHTPGCRSKELEEIGGIWREVVSEAHAKPQRRAKIVEVTGPAGSGKQSLLDLFFQERLQDKQVVAVPLRLAHTSLDTPFKPFVDSLLRAFNIDPKAGLGDQVSALRRVLDYPENSKSNQKIQTALFAQGYRQLPDHEPISPAATQGQNLRTKRALKEVICDAMVRVASTDPLVIAAFDLHKASEESRSLLLSICQEVQERKDLSQLPLLIVYTIQSHIHLQTGDDWHFDRSQVVLGSLDDDQLQQLVEQYQNDGVAFEEVKLKAFKDTGPVMPGRFVSEMVLSKGTDARQQRCDAILARMLRPHTTQPTSDYMTSQGASVGTMTLMSLAGDEGSPSVLASLLLSSTEITANVPRDVIKEYKPALESSLQAWLEQAVTSGALELVGGGGASKNLYRFRDAGLAPTLRDRLRRRASSDFEGRRLSRKLASILVESRREVSIHQWVSAASLMQSSYPEDGVCVDYWQNAGEQSLRRGDSRRAKWCFRHAHAIALSAARSGSPTRDDWITVMETCRCYLYAMRMQDVTPSIKLERRFNEYVRKAEAFRAGSAYGFNARLCQWHLADIRGDHGRASKRVELLRRAIEHAEELGTVKISAQHHRELSYAAWATALGRGSFLGASRYYSQLMTLRVLDSGDESSPVTLSSGHDLEFYAPARHAAVHWLTGDFSGVHELRRMLHKRLASLPPGDSVRRFWAAAYFIPVAVFLGWSETVDHFLQYVTDPQCTQQGSTFSAVGKLLQQMRTIPSASCTESLNKMLGELGYGSEVPVVHSDKSMDTPQHAIQSIGRKHHSVWVCLIARRWVQIAGPGDLPVLANALDQMIARCQSLQEHALIADLYRLRGLACYQANQLPPCMKFLGDSIASAAAQGAVTLEIEAHQAMLDIMSAEVLKQSNAKDKKNVRNQYEAPTQRAKDRLAWLYKQCDFPIGHPVAQSIRDHLSSKAVSNS